MPDLSFYTPREAAALLGVSLSTVHRALANGRLRAIRFGHSVRIPHEDLKAALQPYQARRGEEA